MEAEVSGQGQLIECPQCRHKFPITEALSNQIETKIRIKYEAEARKKEEQLAQKEEELKNRAEQLDSRKSLLDEEVTRRVKEKEKTVETEIRQKIESEKSTEILDLRSQIKEKDQSLKKTEAEELELRKKNRELEEKARNIDLEVARKVDEERKTIEESAVNRQKEEQRLVDKEKDKQLADFKIKVEELNKKLEQKSQQLYGEVLELELEDMLKKIFPMDNIEPVAKGVKGGDVLEDVNNQLGQQCGRIVWESKRTKAWSENWIDKLKEDQRNAKADIAVIVTTILPREIPNFGYYNGIWVTDIASVSGLATALRLSLIELATLKSSTIGRAKKIEILYGYLTSSEFKNRVEAIIEAFRSMQSDLESEKRAIQKNWAKREKQIEKVMENTVGMYGDIQGIIGASLPQIEGLEFKELPAASNNSPNGVNGQDGDVSF
jgi:hypothetical protein